MYICHSIHVDSLVTIDIMASRHGQPYSDSGLSGQKTHAPMVLDTITQMVQYYQLLAAGIEVQPLPCSFFMTACCMQVLMYLGVAGVQCAEAFAQ